ncbi:SDR family oxidoreductase [Glaciecola sp. SC05]|uniref:SDR family oxidoreductase n=1 Tax=Glaciecola sp. SC05 TaxID=1987355 RepID=UPI003529ACCC
MSKNVVIIGANRGIGLELVKQYKAAGHHVIAMCRKSSKALSESGCEIVENIDVTDDALVENIAASVPVASIDILIHNSGILDPDTINSIDFESMRRHFDVNSLGALRTVLGLQSKLKNGSKIGIVSSRVGSIDDNTGSNNYAYRVSKTAVNMVGKCLSIDLKDAGIAVALLHPGYVRTEMTKHNGHMDVDESARGLIKRMEELSLDTSGIFVHTSGEVLNW